MGFTSSLRECSRRLTRHSLRGDLDLIVPAEAVAFVLVALVLAFGLIAVALILIALAVVVALAVPFTVAMPFALALAIAMTMAFALLVTLPVAVAALVIFFAAGGTDTEIPRRNSDPTYIGWIGGVAADQQEGSVIGGIGAEVHQISQMRLAAIFDMSKESDQPEVGFATGDAFEGPDALEVNGSAGGGIGACAAVDDFDDFALELQL